jgi:hypothetical protein
MQGAQGYDVIGDIHGHAVELWNLLVAMGYQKKQGTYQHPTRKALFLGDFIDRGPDQLAVLETVRGMIENDHAFSVMGNHEFNAIGWLAEDDDGRALRPHNEKNYYQHQAFLDAVGEGSVCHHEWVGWFKHLPLWWEGPTLQLVHAAWSPPHMSAIAPYLNDKNCLDTHKIKLFFMNGHMAFDAAETLLKGPELHLGEGGYFFDKSGMRRGHARLRWWMDKGTFRDALVIPEETAAKLPNSCVQRHLDSFPKVKKPTFIGHYWMTGRPEPLSENTACLDYSVAKGGQLVAYRYDGENRLRSDKFIMAPTSRFF